MGFDPMTHRPRTDFFSSLPGLLALANLRDLVDRCPWDDHSISLHAAEAVQTAKLQYLQYLLQSAAAVAQGSTNPASNSNQVLNSMSTHHDLEAMGLLNQSPITYSFGSVPESSLGQGVVDGLPAELQIMPSCYEQQPLSNDTTQGSSSFTLLIQGENTTPRTSPLDGLPPLIDVSVGNPAGDACSTSSCEESTGISSFWPELLLDDPFLTEFPWVFTFFWELFSLFLLHLYRFCILRGLGSGCMELHQTFSIVCSAISVP